MISLLGAVIVGGIGSLLIWLVGVIVCVAIVYAIMRALQTPAWMFTALYVVGLIVLLIVAIDFFFGTSGSVRIDSR